MPKPFIKVDKATEKALLADIKCLAADAEAIRSLLERTKRDATRQAWDDVVYYLGKAILCWDMKRK